MVIIWYILTASGWNMFQNKMKNHRQQKYLKEYIQNTRKWFESVGFIYFTIKGENLLDYINSFSPES